MTADLGNRQLASFLVLSMGLHAIALLAPRFERAEQPLPEPPALVFEMVEAAPETAAPAVAQPPPPPPPPPMEKQPLPPEPVVKASPPPKPPPPKAAPAVKAAPAKPVPVAKAAPTPLPSPAQPVAKTTPAPVAAAKTAPAARARYEDLLYSWLVRHKEYPLVASRRGLQGRPVVTVRIDRRGHVIWSKLSSSSRYEMLDEAAVAMVKRADPFPPVPDDVVGDSYEFVAPVEYRLR